jgi:hypothetical protein
MFVVTKFVITKFVNIELLKFPLLNNRFSHLEFLKFLLSNSRPEKNISGFAFVVLGSDQHFDPYRKLFINFSRKKHKFLEKIKPWIWILDPDRQIFQTQDPYLDPQIIETLDPDPHDMVAAPKI